ncbi:MAG: tetratricopeptide repeat protein [Geminicoccales bacterium]
MVQPSHCSLTTIVSLDLYGYSRLTERDEIGTHRALMTCRRTLLAPIVRDRQGAIVKSTGDGALIRFPTASLAVEAMIRFQEDVAASQARCPPSRRLLFRVGIHLAATIHEEGDVYGHGVNLAVRLQECANPGSIFLSDTVARDLDPGASSSVTRIGRRAFKNIEERVEVYCWPSDARAWGRNGQHIAGLMAAVLLAGIVLPTTTLDETASVLPDTDIVTNTWVENEITRSAWAPMPAMITSTLPAIEWPDRETLAVLPEAEEAWIEPYRGNMDGPHYADVKTTMAESERSLESRGEIAEDAYLQAFALYSRHTPKAFAQAIGELEEALTLEPNHSPAHALLAAIYWSGLQNRWQIGRGLSQADMLNKAKDHLGRAVQTDPCVHMVRSEMLTASGQHDLAIDEAERAIALDPSRAVGHYAKGQALLFAGRAREAEAPIRAAIRLNPHAPRFLFGLALTQFSTNSFDAAERTLARASAQNGDNDWLHLLMAATQGHLGLKAEAQQAIGRFDRLSLVRRGWFASQIPFVHRWPFRDRDDQNRLHLGMVLAGIPEVRQ